jgi:predicted PurR-regulated permease PerM
MQSYFSSEKINHLFLFILFFVSAVISLFVIWPFVLSVILGGIFAIILQPFYKKIQQYIKHREISSIITILFFMVIVCTPLFFVGALFFAEIVSFSRVLIDNTGMYSFFSPIEDLVFRITHEKFMLGDYIQNSILVSTQGIVSIISKLFSSIATLFVQTLIFLLALYYSLIHGYHINMCIKKILPLNTALMERLSDKIILFVGGVMKELFFLSLFRLIVLLVLFSVFGIPNMILWAVIGTIVSIIPGIGIIMTIIPVTLYVASTHNVFIAIFFFAIGLFCAIVVESILGPFFVKKTFNIHPFFILLSMIGGLLLLGFAGFFIGPIVLGIFFVLAEEVESVRGALQKYDFF